MTNRIILTLIFSLLMVGWCRAEPKIITAQGFNLIDDKGNLRASLGFSKDGYPLLAFVHKNGDPYAYFTGSSKGSYIRLYDTKGRHRLDLTVWDNGTPMIIFYDEQGQRQMVLSSLPKYNSIIIYDKKSKPRMLFTVAADQAAIGMLNANRKPKLVLSSHPDLCGMAAFADDTRSNTLVGVLNNKPVVMINRGASKGVMLGYSRRDQPFVAVRHEDGIKWIRPRLDAADLPGLPQQLLELQDHLRAIGGR